MRTSLLHHLMLPRYPLNPSILCRSYFSLIIFFIRQPRKPSTQEQGSDNSPAEDDPINIDTQTVDSLAQQTIDGKKFICSFLSFHSNYKLKSFLMPADTSIESPELTQPDVEKNVDTSSAVPSP